MERIAVFTDKVGNISSFNGENVVKLYEKHDEWEIVKEIPFDNSLTKGVKAIRYLFTELIKELDGCKIIVVTEAYGIPYSVFYGEDFSVWELQGEPKQYFDAIIKREQDHVEDLEREAKEDVVKMLSEGHYYIDLAELELTKPELSSKKAIIPFWEENSFDTLEVHCCHIPPWLEAKRDNKEIKMHIRQTSKNDYTLIISKN